MARGEYGDTGLGATVDFTPDGGSLITFCFIRVSGPTTELGEIEITHSCSTAAEFIADLPDEGTIEVENNLDPDDPTLVDGVEGDIVLKLPPKPGQTTGATFTGRAFIKGAPKTIPVRDRMTEVVTFRVTGPLVHAGGS